MKMFTIRTNQLSNGTVSSIRLRDTEGTTLACNYAECWPTKDGAAQGMLTLQASSLASPTGAGAGYVGTAAQYINPLNLGASGYALGCGMTVPCPAAAGANGPSKAVIDLTQGETVTEVQVINNTGEAQGFILNYGVKVEKGQGWKNRLEPTGS